MLSSHSLYLPYVPKTLVTDFIVWCVICSTNSQNITMTNEDYWIQLNWKVGAQIYNCFSLINVLLIQITQHFSQI